MQILDPVQCVAVMKELGAYSNTWPITMALAEQHSNDAKVRLSSPTLSYSSCQPRASMLTAMEDIPAWTFRARLRKPLSKLGRAALA